MLCPRFHEKCHCYSKPYGTALLCQHYLYNTTRDIAAFASNGIGDHVAMVDDDKGRLEEETARVPPTSLHPRPQLTIAQQDQMSDPQRNDPPRPRPRQRYSPR
jgi:hypothetical protein